MRRWLTGLFALAFAASAPAERLCIGHDCRNATCGHIVEPVEHVRPFVIAGRAGAAFTLGVIPSGGGIVKCSEGSTLRLRIAIPKGRPGNGAKITVGPWSFDASEAQLRAPLAISIPRGDYKLAIERAHCVRAVAPLVVAEKKQELVVELKPLPILSGVVIGRRTRQAVAGALISSDQGSTAITDAAGRFSVEADPDRWPSRLTIRAAAYGERDVAVPRARVSVSLDEIPVSLAGSIRVESAEPLAVELQRLEAGKMVGTPLTAGRTPIHFDDLEPGSYLVLAKGSHPGERFGQPVDLAEGESKPVAIRVSPIRLHLRTEMLGQPVANARVTLMSRKGWWEDKLETDAEGKATITLWQSGEFAAHVYAAQVMTTPYIIKRELDEQSELDWVLDIPSRAIEGYVVDRQSGAPVAKARVTLKIRGGDGGISVSTKTDDLGHFRFAPVLYGMHALRIVALGYLPEERSYSFLDPEQQKQIHVELDPALTVDFTVVDAAGAPVSAAEVLEYDGLQFTGIITLTDERGAATLPVPAGQSRDVFVVPRDGSFAVAALRAGSATARIQVPAGNCRVVIRTESEAHEPIGNVWITLRYNMRVIPPDVLRAFARVQGARIWSRGDGRIVLDHMPAGIYEFWPAGSFAEMQALAAGVGADASAKMSVTVGENVAVMTLARAR